MNQRMNSAKKNRRYLTHGQLGWDVHSGGPFPLLPRCVDVLMTSVFDCQNDMLFNTVLSKTQFPVKCVKVMLKESVSTCVLC